MTRGRDSLAVGIGAALLLIAVALTGCGAPMTVYYKSIATGGAVTRAAYLALDEADRRSVAAISDHAKVDQPGAQKELVAWSAKYDKARKALDTVDDLVANALKEGPALEQVIANKRDVSKWLEALSLAEAAAVQAFADVGLNISFLGVQ